MDTAIKTQVWQVQRNLLGAAWRNRTAQQLTDLGDCSVARGWDPLTIATAKYWKLCADGPNGPARAGAVFPHIDAAVALQSDTAKTDVLKLLALVNVPVADATERVGADPEVVSIWEQLFFDVREEHGARSWLVRHVIEVEHQAGNSALAVRMKLALVAGVDGVNALLKLDQGVPLAEAERLHARRMVLDLKAEEALGLALDSDAQRLHFLKLHAHLQLAERRLDLDERKLAARCTAALERSAQAKLRAEYTQQRTEIRAQEKRAAQAARMAAATLTGECDAAARANQRQAALAAAALSPLAQLTWRHTPSTNVKVPPAESLATPFTLKEAQRAMAEKAQIYPIPATTLDPSQPAAQPDWAKATNLGA